MVFSMIAGVRSILENTISPAKKSKSANEARSADGCADVALITNRTALPMRITSAPEIVRGAGGRSPEGEYLLDRAALAISSSRKHNEEERVVNK
ncbi:hypothetical protein TRAPUB_12377 [Trametes pubescens]|uniref:Uncharacterized protein n=1 Tax=Trametes pubescens TaxID=154538 RepID=A0A1M2VU15_TRAPU|nr:hypothetical protein TRAPUB_12377 [Trametes pubescens]